MWAGGGYFDVSSANNPLLHMWTLSVEEQFYLFFPLTVVVVAWACRRLGWRSSRAVFWTIVAATVLSFVAGVALSVGLPGLLDRTLMSEGLSFYSSPTRAWEFLAGVLLVYFERRLRVSSAWKSALSGFLGAVLVVGSAVVVTGATPTPGVVALAPVVGTALLIASASWGPNWATRLAGTRVAVWIGDRSYGWYLWHWPFIVIVFTSFPTASNWVLLAAGIAALVPTELSYRYIEQPIRKNRSIVGWRAVRLAAICCAIPMLLMVVSRPVNRATTNRYFANRPWQDHLDYASGCNNRMPPKSDDPSEPCTWTVDDPVGHIYLVGDSQAGALSDVIVDRALASGFDITVATHYRCPFARVSRQDLNPIRAERCRRFVDAWTEYLVDERPSLVVIASNEANYVALASNKLRLEPDDAPSSDVYTTAEIWELGLARTLQEFDRADVPVVLVAPVPHYSQAFSADTCPTWRHMFLKDGCVDNRSRGDFDEFRASSTDATVRAMATVANTTRVDFADPLCPGDVCSTFLDGVWMNRDGGHLSIDGAMTLAPVVDAEIISRARVDSR